MKGCGGLWSRHQQGVHYSIHKQQVVQVLRWVMMRLGALIWEEMRNLFMFHTWTPSNVTQCLALASAQSQDSEVDSHWDVSPLSSPYLTSVPQEKACHPAVASARLLVSPQLPLPLVGLASRCVLWLLDTHPAWSQPSANTLTFSEKMTFAFLSLIRKAIKKKMREKEDHKPPMIPCPKYTQNQLPILAFHMNIKQYVPTSQAGVIPQFHRCTWPHLHMKTHYENTLVSTKCI